MLPCGVLQYMMVCGVFFFVMGGRSFLPIGTKKGGYFGLEIVALWVNI